MKNSLLVNVSLVFVSLLFALVFCEVGLRLFFPVDLTGHIGVYQYDEELGVRLKEDIYSVNVSNYRQEMKTDVYGTVGYKRNFKDYSNLVFSVGDSYTQGSGVPLDTNYPFYLDILLNTADDVYGNEYGVVNLGLAAYGLEQSIIVLQRYGKFLGNPKYILFLGCPNDFDDDVLFLDGYRHKHLVDGSPYWGVFIRPLQFLTNELEIGKRIKLATAVYRQGGLVGIDKFVGLGDTVEKENIAQKQEERLERLHSVSVEMGAKLIVSWSDLPTGNSLSYQWLKQWAEERDVGFADWAPLVISVKSSMPDLPIMNDHSGGHHRSWVNSIIARAFVGQIKKPEDSTRPNSIEHRG
jgi:hypothetical protein